MKGAVAFMHFVSFRLPTSCVYIYIYVLFKSCRGQGALALKTFVSVMPSGTVAFVPVVIFKTS